MSRRAKQLSAAGAALFWIALWYIAARLVGLPLVLPGPDDTLRALWALLPTAAFWRSVMFSLFKVLAGYTLAVAIGSLLGLACAKWAWVDSLTAPLRAVIRSTPVSSFIILVLLWLRLGLVPVFISFLMVLPVIWSAMQQGFEQVSGELLEMAWVYRFNWPRRIGFIYAPSVAPYFYAACSSSIGIAWKAGIAAEVIARPEYSIGKYLQDTKVYLQTDHLFAWTLTVILLSLLFEFALKRLLRGSCRWEGKA